MGLCAKTIHTAGLMLYHTIRVNMAAWRAPCIPAAARSQGGLKQFGIITRSMWLLKLLQLGLNESDP